MSITIRHRATIALLLVALLIPLAARPADATVDSGAESRFVQLVNQARARAGLPALSVASDLVSVARRHSVRMADSGDLYHNPNVASEVSGWQKLGENVGRGPTVDSIHEAFLNSPGHRANVLSRDFTQVGVGVEVREGGRIWVTQVFRLPQQAPAPTPEPAPEPEAAPAPAPQPAQTAAASSPTRHAPAAGSASNAPSTPTAPSAPAATEAVARPPVASNGAQATLVLARFSARDLGMSVAEALPPN
ncbi:MAG: CAP domain-containing protein [Actinobacteria bacterium]|nr:CAP domain-containing protein [Actinomycetota bacterium]